MSSCFSRCLRVPIAIRAFYESYLWILQTLSLTHPDLHPGLLGFSFTPNCESSRCRRTRLTCNARARLTKEEWERLVSRTTGNNKTATSAGWPPSMEFQVAMPGATNNVRRPFSSAFACACPAISRTTLVIDSSFPFGSNFSMETGSTPDNSVAIPADSADVRSSEPVVSGGGYRRLLRRERSIRLRFQLCRALSTCCASCRRNWCRRHVRSVRSHQSASTRQELSRR